MDSHSSAARPLSDIYICKLCVEESFWYKVCCYGYDVATARLVNNKRLNDYFVLNISK